MIFTIINIYKMSFTCIIRLPDCNKYRLPRLIVNVKEFSNSTMVRYLALLWTNFVSTNGLTKSNYDTTSRPSTTDFKIKLYN